MYPTIALLSLMLFMWGAAIWATYRDDHTPAANDTWDRYSKAA